MYNRLSILNIIRENSGLSRQELAKRTGLTPAAMSGIVRELVQNGYVMEVGLGKSSGGRRPIQLQFNPQAGYVVGAEITRSRTILGMINLSAGVVLIEEKLIDMTDPEVGLSVLLADIETIIARSGIPKDKVMGMGFAFPGLIEQRTKVIKRSPNLGDKWTDFPVKDWLEQRMDIPLFVEHNANAAAAAEVTLGKGHGVQHLVYVNLGEGISAGVIIDGKPFYGSFGYAGEVGHTVIVENGPLCNCGNKGCLESLYAAPALVRKANQELPLYRDDALKRIWLAHGTVAIEDIIKAARVPNSYAWELVRQAGWYIGAAISNIVNLFNPEVVCLGGILSGAWPIMKETFQQSMETHSFPETARNCVLEVSDLGRDAGFFGACLGAIDQLFNVDELSLLD
ncbi:N-acetylglucosamine repressor [Peptococcaceae bacterium CEB3]|nr:N-acetylglucosamine repressor [Peptococcaceae bacterium CEB3]